jgi:hypothetical protein
MRLFGLSAHDFDELWERILSQAVYVRFRSSVKFLPTFNFTGKMVKVVKIKILNFL